MGRKRKDGNPLGLEPRVEWHHGQFRYLHRDGRKEGLGADVDRANRIAQVYNDKHGIFGTLAYYLPLYLSEARAGTLPAKRKLAGRTLEDYEKEAELIGLSPLGSMTPAELVDELNLIGEYRDRRAAGDKGQVQANHAMSLLSGMYAWLIERRHCPGLLVNPVKLVKRFTRAAKAKYVQDQHYTPALARARPPVAMAMRLVYATLQRPSDVLALPPSPVSVKTVAGVAKRVLHVRQGKRGRVVDIEVTPEIDEILGMLAPAPNELGSNVRRLATALVHNRRGAAYTENGMGANLRRTCAKAGVPTFGLMDVRAKGATDMYLRGVPLEHIQALMAHKSKTTTEIYIKAMLATISVVAPNTRAAA